MKILILSDKQGWIVDRISEEFKKRIKHDIDIDYYTTMTGEELLRASLKYDLIHFNNWDIRKYLGFIPMLQCKTLMTVRSHRYYPEALILASMVTKVHVINELQLKEFPQATYIPDGIFIKPAKFKVGMAFQDNEYNREYKGYNIVKEACDELGVILEVASDKKPEEMPKWLKSLDLYVCASIAEGHSTMVMEALSLNVPVITTPVGVPASIPNLEIISRNKDIIKRAIERRYTAKDMKKYSWNKICKQMGALYETI